jgi:membrane protease subunit (stomatin/prohibitin family)
MDANIYLKDSSGNVLGSVANPLVVYPATGTFDIVSPLTTKGDLLTYTTTNTRLAVATVDEYVVKSDSTQPEGIKWGQVAHTELTGIDGSTYHLDATGYASVNTWNVAPANKGVTNGDSHDHIGGDGASITESAISLSDITTNDASTTKHGFAPKAVAPAANLLNVLGIINGESAFSNKALFDSTAPSPLGTAAAGTNIIAARQGHIHPNYTAAGVGIGIGKGSAPSYLLEIKGTASTDLPTYSDEFLDADNWTSADWTGSWAAGWSHTVGNTTVLSHDHAAVNSTKYQIAYTVTGRTAGTFTITFGGQTSDAISATGAWGPVTTGTGFLQITPTTDFNGTIVISIKSVTGSITPINVITDSGGNIVCEQRGGNVTTNTFIGVSAGRTNSTGYSNTFIGVSAGRTNSTGYSNTFIGVSAGYTNSTGYSNTFLGGDAGYTNSTGIYNTFIGVSAGYTNSTGIYNTFLGGDAGRTNSTGYSNTFLGVYAGRTNSTGYHNTFIGVSAGRTNSTGYSNTFIGVSAGRTNSTGYSNTFIGVYAGYTNSTGYSNTFLGGDAGYTNSTGYSNTFLGGSAGYNANQLDTAVNSMGLGYGSFTTRSNQVVIGDHNVVETHLRTGVYIGSTSSTAHTQPTARLHIAAGSATAGTAPIKLTAGTVNTSPEDGAFEYDGTNLYFTIGATRRTITVT